MNNDTTYSVKSTLNNDTPHPSGAVPQDVTHGAQVPGNEPQGNPSPVATRQSIPLSDSFNAQALVYAYGIDLRYCHHWRKWLTWTDTHWQLDTAGTVMRYARNTVLSLTAQGKTLPEDMPQGLYAHREKSLNASRLEAMVKVAQSWEGIPVQPEDLDRDPWLLNCLNGTLDLRTGALCPHQRADLITKCLPVAYDPQAQCPLWHTFLQEIMAGNANLIAFLQRAIGYALTGVIREHVLFILYGTGRNGKSTFLNTIMAMLGAYAMKAPAELLMASKYDRHPTEKADLHGKRLVAASETEQGRKLAEVLVKELTGGDPIRAHRMREDFWQFNPTHKVFLATNHKPVITGTDHAIWERIRLIPFTVTIPPEKRDTTLPDRLQTELQGVLAWAVQGCLAWQQVGLHEPAEVHQATADYRAEMDIVGQFIAECCYVGPEYKARATDLYTTFTAWCAGNGEPAEMSQHAFGSALLAHGFERYTSNGTWYRGLGLPVREEELGVIA